MQQGIDADKRVSITNTVCLQKEDSKSVTCLVSIGIDDLSLGVKGWEAVKRLDFAMDEKGKVVGAALTEVAQ